MMRNTTYRDVNDVLPLLSPEQSKYAVALLAWDEDALWERSRSLVLDGEAIAIAGASMHLDDRYLVGWAFIPRSVAETRKLTLMRWAKQCLAEMDATLAPRRFEVSVRAEEVGHYEFAEVLGLEPEGLMRAYGPDGTDYIRMARIRE